MRDKLGEKVRVEHMLEAIEYINQFMQDKQMDDLEKQPMFRFALERQLEIIGEASRYISQSVKDQETLVPWAQVKAFRNIIAHEYFGIDPEIIWKIVTVDIPVLQNALKRIIKNL